MIAQDGVGLSSVFLALRRHAPYTTPFDLSTQMSLSFGSRPLSPCRIPETIIGMNLNDAQQLLSGTGKLIQIVKIGDRVTPDHNRNRLRVGVDADGKVRAFYCG